jgi:hypothetical protein
MTMDTALTRRELLTILVMVPVVGESLACSSSNGSPSSTTNPEVSSAGPDDASACEGSFETSTVTNNHTHALCVPTTDLTAPPSEGVIYTTSFDAGHDHTVTLTQAQLQSIEAGTAVTVTTSSPYPHNFTIAKP